MLYDFRYCKWSGIKGSRGHKGVQWSKKSLQAACPPWERIRKKIPCSMSCKMQLKGTKFVDLMVLVGFVKMRGARITFHLRAFHCAIDLNFFALRTRAESQDQKYAFSFFRLFWESTNQFLRCILLLTHTYWVHNLVATSNYLSYCCSSMVSNPPDLWPSDIFKAFSSKHPLLKFASSPLMLMLLMNR